MTPIVSADPEDFDPQMGGIIAEDARDAISTFQAKQFWVKLDLGLDDFLLHEEVADLDERLKRSIGFRFDKGSTFSKQHEEGSIGIDYTLVIVAGFVRSGDGFNFQNFVHWHERLQERFEEFESVEASFWCMRPEAKPGVNATSVELV